MPFDIARAYWIKGVPTGETRGNHSHLRNRELVIPVEGSFSLTLTDGDGTRTMRLANPEEGILVEPRTWHSLSDFSPGAVCLVLASEEYRADDSIHDFDDFLSSISGSVSPSPARGEGSCLAADGSYEVRLYSPAGEGEWNEFVRCSRNGTFLLDRGYMDYHAHRFTDCSFMAWRKGRLCAVLPGNLAGTDFISHEGLTYGGLIMSDRATAADVLAVFSLVNRALRGLGAERVVYRPAPYIYHAAAAQEDLYALSAVCGAAKTGCDISSAICLSRHPGFRESRRSGMRKARNRGIAVRRSDDFRSFWRLLEANLFSRFGARPVHSADEICLLAGRFPHNIRLYIAEEEGVLVGGTVVYVMGRTVHTQYISASPRGKAAGALDAIFSHLIRSEFADYDWFDFGRSIDREGVLNPGLIFQKEGFGARAVCYDTYSYAL